MKQRPLFITFEGCESSGKTTQSKMLFEWCKKINLDCVLTREPGGTKTAEKIRSIILDDTIDLDIKSQLLLHFVSRIEHVKNIINPALSENKIVICDRFFDSTIVYQHYGAGLNLEFMEQMHREFLDNITPDITFVLNIDFDIYKKRMSLKNSYNDRYENLPDEYHKKIISGFQKISSTHNARCCLIDSAKPLIQIHNYIVAKVSELIL